MRAVYRIIGIHYEVNMRIKNYFDEIDLSKTYSYVYDGHVSHVLSAGLSSHPMGWSLFV